MSFLVDLLKLPRTRRPLFDPGLGSSAQPDSAGTATTLQPAPAAIGCRTNQSPVTDVCSTSAQASGLKTLAHGSRGTSTLSGNDKGSTFAPLTRTSKCDAEGKPSASRSTSVPQTNAGPHKLLPNKSSDQNTAETCADLKNKDPLGNNGPRTQQLEKSVSSLKLQPCMTRQNNHESTSAAMQADTAGNAAAVKQTSVTATKRINLSGVASSSPNPVNLNSRRLSSLSNKDMDPSVPPSGKVASRINQFEKNSTSSGKEKEIAVRPAASKPTMSAPNVPAQGRSASSNAAPQSGADISKSLPKKIQTGGTIQSNNVPINKDLSEIDAAKTASLKQPVPRSSQQTQMCHIKVPGPQQESTPLLPLGERCQLCGIDLAFMAKNSGARPDELPFSAVLPCSHSYHDSCLRDLFGPVEPPCVRCLEVAPPQGG
ncbi:uncharacterized protein LOC109844251 isoform X2 [Asparagus officinalis]|uniref:uncharacterized protein LOC109844251 isoform X2 n=1 Tax=Asparagus officinalis TaxID=4686 RepID=UPI00098E5B7E|nr:uncharacterized protein LOC109844251 isoform X2 [Asparagus officinalis]